jgi:hypothetical protein
MIKQKQKSLYINKRVDSARRYNYKHTWSKHADMHVDMTKGRERSTCVTILTALDRNPRQTIRKQDA